MGDDTVKLPDDREHNDDPSARPTVQMTEAERARVSSRVPDDLKKSYEILHEIARGGMGVVYKARQKTPSRIVALKLLIMGSLASVDEKSRFLREADAAARLKHPGIVPIYEVGETHGSYYFSMEYVEGVTLGKHLKMHNRSIEEKLDLFQHICEIVTHAHMHGVIHRDLKPANIMIDREGNPRILDFGLAKLTGPAEGQQAGLTLSGVLLGTPAYMSPEQTLGKPDEIDTRSDVYSLGVILYEMLTGTMPYPVDVPDPIESLRNIREKEPKRPSTIIRILRDDLETIILKAISKEKERRYAGAADFARDIQHYLNNEPIEARPAGTGYKLRKAVQRHKVLSAAIAIVVVAFLVAFIWVNTARREAERQRVLAQEAAIKARLDEARVRALLKQAEKDKDRIEWESYINALALADVRIQNMDFEQAWKLLKNAPARLRGWEWGMLMRLASPGLLTVRGHSLPILSAEFSPDGKRIVTGGMDDTAIVWDAATLRQLRVLRGHTDEVASVSFDPSGRRILTGGWDSIAKVWDAASGRELFALRGHSGSITGAAFSPDGKRILTASRDHTARVWSAAPLPDGRPAGTELLMLKGHKSAIWGAAWSPDGKRIATASSDKTAKVWDAASGKPLLTLEGHTDQLWPVVFSPDGKWIATGSYDRTVRIWDAAAGKQIACVTAHASDVLGVAFSPDGKWLVTTSRDKMVKVWAITRQADGRPTLQEHSTLKGHSGSVFQAAFSRDGRRFITASRDGTAKTWPIPPRPSVVVLKSHSGRVDGRVAVSPDGRRVATVNSDRTATIWDADTGKRLFTLSGHRFVIRAVVFSRDGKRIVTAGADATAKVWDAEHPQKDGTPRELLTLKGHTRTIWAADISPDGTRIATGSEDRTARIWDANTGEMLHVLKGHTGGIWSVAFSPDGKSLATGSGDRSARLWSVATGKQVARQYDRRSAVSSVLFDRDGKWLVARTNVKVLSLWDGHSGKKLFTLRGHSDSIVAVVLSPDGRRIVTGSTDRTAKIWDATSGRELFTLKGHTLTVRGVAFSGDGRKLATAADDGVTRVHFALDWTKTPEELEPDAAAAYANDGIIARRSGDRDKAIEKLTKAIELAPDYVQAYRDRALVYYLEEDHDRAIADISRAIELAPDDVQAYLFRSKVHANRKDYERAIDDVTKAMEISPDDARARKVRGWYYLKLRDYERAIDDLTKAIQLDPNIATAFRYRAQIYRTMCELDRSIADYTKAIVLDPKEPAGWRGRTLAYLSAGSLEKAADDATKAIAADPKHAYSHMWLFIARARSGKDGREELAAFAETLEKDEWTARLIQMLLGKITPEQCLAAAADPDAEMDKGHRCEVFYYAGQLHLIHGKTDKARECFGKTIATGVSEYVEYDAARNELMRLKK